MCVLIGSGTVIWIWEAPIFPEALKCFKLENEKLVNASLCELTLYIKMKSLLHMSLVFVETTTQTSLQRIYTA